MIRFQSVDDEFSKLKKDLDIAPAKTYYHVPAQYPNERNPNPNAKRKCSDEVA